MCRRFENNWAPILVCKFTWANEEGIFDVNGVYISLCPVIKYWENHFLQFRKKVSPELYCSVYIFFFQRRIQIVVGLKWPGLQGDGQIQIVEKNLVWKGIFVTNVEKYSIKEKYGKKYLIWRIEYNYLFDSKSNTFDESLKKSMILGKGRSIWYALLAESWIKTRTEALCIGEELHFLTSAQSA